MQKSVNSKETIRPILAETISLKKYVPTPLYDTFWRYAAERQTIFCRRFHGELPPWTNDRILEEYRFTNVYRVLDRVSQFLIKEVIGSKKKYSPSDTFFRILFFKIFNKIETWERLEKELGEISYTNYSFQKFDHALSKLINKGYCIYSAAYIMPSGVSSFGFPRKHQNDLKLLEMIMKSDPIKQIQKMKSLKDLYFFFLSFPTIGNFLAFQYAIDVNYSNLSNFSEMDFVVAGPGAIRGIRKCFSKAKIGDSSTIIRLVTSRQCEEFAERDLHFDYLGNRKLQLIDVQNLFCEIDKYSRELEGYRQSGHRIKQKYRINPARIDYVLPQKWNAWFFGGGPHGI